MNWGAWKRPLAVVPTPTTADGGGLMSQRFLNENLLTLKFQPHTRVTHTHSIHHTKQHNTVRLAHGSSRSHYNIWLYDSSLLPNKHHHTNQQKHPAPLGLPYHHHLVAIVVLGPLRLTVREDDGP